VPLAGRQRRARRRLGQEPAAFYFDSERGPAPAAVLTGHSQLCRR
jgi:hypothetical protein